MKSNYALIWACSNMMQEVAFELLKIKCVQVNAAAVSNEALRWTCENKMEGVALPLRDSGTCSACLKTPTCDEGRVT